MEQGAFPTKASEHIARFQCGKVSETANTEAAQQSDQFGVLQDTD
jgi:hypothetical protein